MLFGDYYGNINLDYYGMNYNYIDGVGSSIQNFVCLCRASLHCSRYKKNSV